MASGLSDDLTRFLDHERGRRWSWAETNCALWVADWVRASTGLDPARDVRGRAASADDWKALLDAEGGFMPMVGHAMDTCGFDRTQSPTRGDAAIVSVPVALCNRIPVVGAVMAICLAPATRHGWPTFVCRSLRGFHYERFAMVTAWRITRGDSKMMH